MHFPKVAIADKNRPFFVSHATGTSQTYTKNGHIINFFKYSFDPLLERHFKQIQINIRNRIGKCTRKVTEVNKSPEVHTKHVHDGQFSILLSSMWWNVCAFFRDVVFFKLYILALCLKSSIHPQLNTLTSKKTLEIVHFISNYWNIMGSCF